MELSQDCNSITIIPHIYQLAQVEPGLLMPKKKCIACAMSLFLFPIWCFRLPTEFQLEPVGASLEFASFCLYSYLDFYLWCLLA